MVLCEQGGEGGELGLIFVGYVPLASESLYLNLVNSQLRLLHF